MKKFNLKSLVDQIEKATREKLKEHRVVSLADYRGLSKRTEPRTVLVVEDDETVRLAMKRVLEKDGYRVKMAADSQELTSLLDDTPIELIVLDVGLPWINGFELAQMMKAHTDLKHIPLIFVSGLTTDDDIKKGFSVGCDDYLKKPFDIEEFRKTIKTLMALNS